MTRPLPVAIGENAELLGATVHYLPGGDEPLTELAPDGLHAHRLRFGARPTFGGASGRQLIGLLADVELTGRGGAHFPVARKWREVVKAARTGGPAVVVANAAEGEPLSCKDTALLELRPHLVLDGLVTAAEVLGADRAVLWLHDDAHRARGTITRALTERAELAEPAIEVAFAPAKYLSGESSAVVNALSGREALPSLARVPAARRGVDGRPTLVQNVETLARVALLARGWLADSVLVTVAGKHHSVVSETPSTTSVAAAVCRTTGADPLPYAVLVGGYGGRWVTWREARSTRVARAGAGVLVPLVPGQCGLARTAQIVEYMAASGARQCGPCAFGLPATARLLEELAGTSARRRDFATMQRYLGEIAGRGACHHPDGVVSLVRSALTTFAHDVQAHLAGHCRQRAGRE